MPTLPMAPIPPEIQIAQSIRNVARAVAPSHQVELVHPDRDQGKNPGYPFFIPGIAGLQAASSASARFCRRRPDRSAAQRRLTPSYRPERGQQPVLREAQHPGLLADFFHLDKDGKTTSPTPLVAQELPEDGTPPELAAMTSMSRASTRPTGPMARRANSAPTVAGAGPGTPTPTR